MSSIVRHPSCISLLGLVAACAPGSLGESVSIGEESAAATVAQTCTVTNARGNPVSGTVCGGTSHGLSCTPGVLYRCEDRTRSNNCSLKTTCAVGCTANPGSSLKDTCFTGTPPLQLSTSSVAGGSEITATVTLAASFMGTAYDNPIVDRSDLVGFNYCNSPDLEQGTHSVSFPVSTAVVSATTPTRLAVNLGYWTSSGSFQLAGREQVLTLEPGGTSPPPPPIESFTLAPDDIKPGGVAIMDVLLSRVAPMTGVQTSVTSSDPSVAMVIAAGQPFVQGGCRYGGGAATIQAASSVASSTTVTIGVSDGAPGQAPLTAPLTITSGCTPAICFSGMCGAMPDGCGGTIHCGLCTGALTECVDNVCTAGSCTPATCAGLGFDCGTASDGCGGALSCGTCAAPETCGGGGQANVCGGGSGGGSSSPCPTGSSQVAVSVGGAGGTVTSRPSGIDVSTGATDSTCFQNGTEVELEATRDASWSGTSCDDGNSDEDRCRFTLGSSGVSITANLL